MYESDADDDDEFDIRPKGANTNNKQVSEVDEFKIFVLPYSNYCPMGL